MIDLTTQIIPYVGTGIFKLDSSYDEVKALLVKQNISYKEEISQPNDIDPPWYIIGISKVGEKDNVMSITFAKNRLLQGSSFLSVTDNGLNFNKNVVKHMQRAESVKIFYNSSKKQIAIQKCDKNTENSIPFYRDEKNLKSGVRFNNREVQQMIATTVKR